LAYEVEPFGIDVVLIEPGPYRTEIWDSSPRIKPPNSAYRAFVEPLETALDKQIATSLRDPQEVAAVIAQALEARRPRFRYPVSPEARIGHFLRGKIPSRLLRRAVARYLGIANVKP
jgi:NAD(P)-dependent dehydrogenase (short-subunit alcohol dehydrogenase family)